MSDRKKTGWTFWITASVVVLVAYPLSIGPLAWLDRRVMFPGPIREMLKAFYVPLDWLVNQNDLLTDMLLWYLRLWIP